VVKEMAAKAREENDVLAARVAELEKATKKSGKKPVRKVTKKSS